MRKELLKGLTDEQIRKVEACKNPAEILELAKAEGVELSEEQLEAVSGGCGGGKEYEPDVKCPICGSHKVNSYDWMPDMKKYICQKCNELWYAKP